MIGNEQMVIGVGERVAGLDVSLTNTGIAVITGDGQADYFSFGYSLKKGSELDRQDRICQIANKSMGFLRKYSPFSMIGFEDYAYSRAGKLTMLAELCGVLKNQCYIGLNRAAVVIPPTSVRKVLLGTSAVSKEAVRDYLEKTGYPPVKDLDQSDALAVAEVCRRWMDGTLAESEAGASLRDRIYKQMKRRN